MKLSSKSDYCIRALVDLAQNPGRGPVPSRRFMA
jgi:DNA-binding IscR family transcriptional regulator